MDTSLVNVDLHPAYIRLEIKGEVTQLKFEEDILVDKSKLQRSTTTGSLLLTMPKASITEVEAKNLRLRQLKDERAADEKLRKLEKEQMEAKAASRKALDARAKKVNEESKDGGEFIIRESKKEESEEEEEPKEEGEGKDQKSKRMFVPDFDVDDVPPLE